MILASASPRRQALLRGAGVEFYVKPAHIDESRMPGEAPLAYVQRMALEKAARVATPAGPPVLAADTIVHREGEVFGKPGTPEEARATLSVLSGQAHEVATAVCLWLPGGPRQILVRSQVYFRVLSRADIDRYIATGEPFDKAGGYGIQGEGMGLIERVEGSYTNVVGLPLSPCLALLAEAGLRPGG